MEDLLQSARPFASVAVIGGGAWGAALAHLTASNGIATRIWAREPEVAAGINGHRQNTVYLPGITLAPGISATAQLDAVADAEAFLLVVPAQFSRSVFTTLGAAHRNRPVPVCLCSKGVEATTGRLLTEVLAETWPGARAAVLSGPSFARDVAQGLPTAVTLACPDQALSARWVKSIGSASFRLYLSDDLIGAELGGAIKNVLAIAAGAVEGRGLGESARAALIARGFREFQRLGAALGARPETMQGLSGLGDLILTATSAGSRNMSLGRALGSGQSVAAVLSARVSVAEGVASAAAIVRMADRVGVDAPVTRAVADLVAGTRGIDAIIADLMARPLKAETA